MVKKSRFTHSFNIALDYDLFSLLKQKKPEINAQFFIELNTQTIPPCFARYMDVFYVEKVSEGLKFNPSDTFPPG